MHNLKIKRIYEEVSKDDGIRILVDRLWPMGVSKERTHLDYWFKDIAPDNDLRKWFNHKAEKFSEFSKQYREELKNNEYIAKVREMLKKNNVTLLYGAKDAKINHAIVLCKYILNGADLR